MNQEKKADPQVKLRIPEKMKELLQSQAAQNRRTLNGEIIFRLDQSLAEKQA